MVVWPKHTSSKPGTSPSFTTYFFQSGSHLQFVLFISDVTNNRLIFERTYCWSWIKHFFGTFLWLHCAHLKPTNICYKSLLFYNLRVGIRLVWFSFGQLIPIISQKYTSFRTFSKPVIFPTTQVFQITGNHFILLPKTWFLRSLFFFLSTFVVFFIIIIITRRLLLIWHNSHHINHTAEEFWVQILLFVDIHFTLIHQQLAASLPFFSGNEKYIPDPICHFLLWLFLSGFQICTAR